MLKDKLTLLPEIKMLDEEDPSDGCLTAEELAEVLIQNEIYINEASIVGLLQIAVMYFQFYGTKAI